jgi:hypothetical protein
VTVHSREQARPAAPACQGHTDSAAPASEGVPRAGQRGAGGSALGVVLALPRWARILGAVAVLLGALLAVGVPFASFAPLLAVGGCLVMHLLMGHGTSHGGGHAGHGKRQAGADRDSQGLDNGGPH